MGNRREFAFTTPSAHRLTSMSSPDLEALHKDLKERSLNSHHSGGSRHLRTQARNVGSELKRRARHARPEGSTPTDESMKFRTVQASFGKERSDARLRVLVVGGHFDDWVMAGGLVLKLVDNGADVSIATLTDGGKNGKPQTRWEEEKQVVGEAGFKSADAILLPDGELAEHLEEAIDFLGNVVDRVRPDAIVATNEGDPHSDHAAANLVALEVAGKVPVHAMETIWSKDFNGNPLLPNRVVPITQAQALRVQQLYLTYASQTQVRTPDVKRVLDMSRTSGSRIGIKYGSGYFEATNAFGNDPLGEFLVYQAA